VDQNAVEYFDVILQLEVGPTTVCLVFDVLSSCAAVVRVDVRGPDL